MAFILSDRVKETTSTTGTGTYTLGGASTGFESFASIGNSNTTYYCCTDGTDFEVGIGTYTASGTTLARTTILQSSNSDNAVNWSAGTREIFCTLPAEKSVVKDASGHVNLADNEELRLGADGDLVIRHAGSNSLIEEKGGGNLIIKADPVFLLEKTGTSNRMILANASGSVELYHNNVKKLETRSDGVTITGNLQFAESHGSDSRTRIFTETESTNNQQTNLIIQAGDDATTDNEDSVRIRHSNYGNVSPQDFDMAIFKRNASDNTKADINFNGDLTLTSTADLGPVLTLISNDPSDATDFHVEGTILFKAENSASEETSFAEIKMTTADITDGTEDGRIRVNLQSGGNGLVDSYQLAANRLFLEHDQHSITWNNTRGTSFDVDLVTATPTATRTITLPDATGTVLLDTGNQTLTGDLTFPDDEKAVFGTGSDLTISHESSGNHSVIRESGTGNLYIDASNLYLRASQSDSFAAHASFTTGGATQLYHNGTEKFITESTGIKATGNVLAEDGYVGVGDISADNWAKFHYVSSDPTGFSSQYTNAAVISNEQGTANQHLYLFDTTQDNTNDLFGLSTGVPIFSITGQGHLVFKRPQGNTSYDVTLACPTPTAARTITLPNASGNVQLNQGSGETNGTFQNFQQDYQSSSYFVAGEYIEIATLNPTTNSSNYNFVGTIIAQISQNIQVLDIKVGIRYSSSGSISKEVGYNSHQIGGDYVEPVLWSNTSTNTVKLLIKGKSNTVHKVGVNLTFFQRGAYDDITWNTTAIQDTTSIPSGYTEHTGEKVSSFITHGAVELYHNNIKKLETTSTGVTVTGLLSATTKSFDIEHPTKHNMRLKHGSLEGPEHGVYVRGILTDENVIELPDYWTGLVHEDSITAQLTPKGHMQQLYVKEIRDNKVYVENTSATKIDCFYFIQGNRKDTEGFEVEYES